MNIETANRLYELRKKSGLSQEELAEKLGISRQSISKWERAEASPDTDNLILLAKLYGITLDELIMGGDKAENADTANAAAEDAEASKSGDAAKKDTKVHIGLDGIHVEDDEDVVHVTWKGIHIEDKGREAVHVGKDGVRINNEDLKGDSTVVINDDGDGRTVIINGKRVDPRDHRFDKGFWNAMPVPLMCIIAFLLLGFLLNAWGTAWIVFLFIPIYYSLINAIKTRDARHFAFPVLVAAAYLLMGFFLNLWHPGWVVFLLIPVYYSVAHLCYRAYRRKHPRVITVKNGEEDDDCDDDDRDECGCDCE